MRIQKSTLGSSRLPPQLFSKRAVPRQYSLAAERARTIGETVLVLLGLAGVLTTAVIAPNALHLFRYIPIFGEYVKPRRRYELPRTLSRLAQKGWVKKTPLGYALTGRGRRALDQMLLRGIPYHHPRLWDRKWRILMFDVPEGIRFRRDRLRRMLKELGLAPLQKSVWMYPFPCEDILDLLRRRLELGQARVRCLVADTFGGDEEYRAHFGIRADRR